MSLHLSDCLSIFLPWYVPHSSLEEHAVRCALSSPPEVARRAVLCIGKFTIRNMSMEKLFEVCRCMQLINHFCQLCDVRILLAFDWSIFFHNGTSNLKSTAVRTQLCMVASFADIRYMTRKS